MNKIEKAAKKDAEALTDLENNIKVGLENKFGYREAFHKFYPEAWTFPVEKIPHRREVPIERINKAIAIAAGASLVYVVLDQSGLLNRFKKHAKVVDLQQRIQEAAEDAKEKVETVTQDRQNFVDYVKGHRVEVVREVHRLKDEEHLTIEEIASKMNIGESSVRTILEVD